ncbi:hypothetical protein ABER98_20955 [Domibacillus aminovorans]|uniref:hypothetical protein n=1 Tax=Domibacillus aminovorans TaxID=29332 RepID=UPI003D219636
MIKKQNKATIYLTASLLIAIGFFILLLNQFLTNDHAPAEEKQLVTTEPKTAVPKEEKDLAIQTEKESEKESEEKAETNENQGEYVADWFKQFDEKVFEEQPVEEPSPPVKPEQPSFSSSK